MTLRVEIWELLGPFWSLPVRVVWYDTLAEIRVGGGARLTAKMQHVAEQRLATVATLKGTTFWTTRARLETVAKQFWGEDAEDVIQWRPTKTEKAPVRSDYEPDQFVKAYCQSACAVCRDTLIVNAIWLSLCKFMLNWLLNEKRTLNLIFAELNAFCLRKNWAGAVAKNERDRYKRKRINPREYLSQNRQSMVDRGVAEYLVTRPATGFDLKSRTLVYSLDCRTNRHWDRMVQEMELATLSETRGAYMNRVATQLRIQLPEVLKSYARYLEEASHPNATVSQDFVGGKDLKRTRKTGRRGHQTAAGPWDAGVILRPSSEADSGSELREFSGQTPPH